MMKIVIERISKYKDEDRYAKALDCVRDIEPERCESIMRIKSEDNRLRAMSAGMLIKDMCDKLDIAYPKVLRDEHGKPYIEGHPEIYFNISHSGMFAVLAYGDKPVGIDIQETRNVTESFARRILNESEYDSYDMSDPKAICRVWTVKEAYSKLLGLGLGYDFRDCVVDTDNKTVSDINGAYGSALYRSYRPAPDVYMSYVMYTDTEIK